MNKVIIIVLVVALVGGGAYYINQQNQETARLEQIQLEKAEEARQRALAEEAKRLAAEKAKQRALEEARRMEAEAQKAKELAMQEAKRLEEAAKQKAADLQSKLNGLVSQAKSSLDNGKYQEAIDSAKSILSQDPNNPEAKSILEIAMAKLKEYTQEQAAAAITEDPKKTLDAVTSGIKLP